LHEMNVNISEPTVNGQQQLISRKTARFVLNSQGTKVTVEQEGTKVTVEQ